MVKLVAVCVKPLVTNNKRMNDSIRVFIRIFLIAMVKVIYIFINMRIVHAIQAKLSVVLIMIKHVGRTGSARGII